ncbi:MAG: right-handed parallel beta-helix repeat-containing protein, partial [Candidatus Thorarchaeota archaeon]|nr:right-handed parallel beta-helix repeat-containing protein [Candidatus Thorarchaeota archaeon]
LLVPQSIQHANDGISNSRQFVTSETTPHDEIVITHNDNFTTQGWQGNGTVDDPFLISGLEITSDTECVNISNTDMYFVIENCYLTSDDTTPSGYAISLESVQNGEIRDVIITRKAIGIIALDTSDTSFSNITIYDTGLGIDLRESADCSIANSTIIGSLEGSAINLYNSDHCDIGNNRLLGNQVGFLSNSSEWITITNNTIVGNSIYGIQSTSGSKKLSVYWNRIGWNSQNAIDNGTTKFWDNGNLGNWWSDGDNETDYVVPGSANAKDRHPQVWNDTIGPDISTQLSSSESEGVYSVQFSVDAIDDVAINQVILSISQDGGITWTNTTMDWSYSSWTSSVESLSLGSVINYVVYVSDYAGNWETTSEEEYTVPLETDTSTTTATTTTTTGTDTNPTSGTGTNTTTEPGGNGSGTELVPIIAIIGVAALLVIVAIIMYKNPDKFGRSN